MTRERQKMRIFRNAIVRRPCRVMTEGITSGLYPGRPDYELALAQHDAYIEALRRCHINVTVLPADEDYPDSCFVEDPAVLTERCAIITNPGAASRNGEKTSIDKAEFDQYNRYEIPEKEAYAANCIWVNDTVIVPDGYPAVLDAVKSMGYETITVDTSEFRKLDGGLSCLSLRF